MKKYAPALIPVFLLMLLFVFALVQPASPAEPNGKDLPVVLLPDQELVVFLAETEAGLEVFALDPLSSAQPIQITQTDGQVLDFAASPDGERISYSITNDAGGSQLWEFLREAGFSKLIKDCGETLCSEPAYSPDAAWLAYTKIINRMPQVWLLNLNDGTERALFGDLLNVSEMPLWSPDGSKVAVWNAGQSVIEIAELVSGETWKFGNVSGDRGSWSPDSNAIYFQDTIPGETAYSNGVRRIDLVTGERTPVACSCKDESGNAYLHPVVNPVDGRIVVGVQAIPLVATRELWLMDPEGNFITAISDDLSVLTTRAVWSPDGTQVLFTRNEFPIQEPAAELILWDSATQTGGRILSEGAIGTPGWLTAVE